MAIKQASNLLRPGTFPTIQPPEADQALINERTRDGDPTTPNERALIHHIMRTRIAESIDKWKSTHKHMEEAMRYYEDDQWIYYDSSKREIVRPPTNKQQIYPRRSVNYLAIMADAIVARILSGRPRPEAVPGSMPLNFTQRKQNARMANVILGHIDRVNQGETINQRHALQGVLAGVSWKRTWYDSTQMGQIKTGGDVKRVTTGEILYDTISPLNVIHDYGAPFRFITWLCEVEHRQLSYIRNEYVNGKYVIPNDARQAHRFPLTELMGRGVPMPKSMESDQEQSQRVLPIYHFYGKEANPNTGSYEWWSFSWCEDTVLQSPVRVGENPYTPWYFNLGLMDNMPRSLIWELIPLQRELNQALQGWAYRRRLHQFPKLVTPQGYLPEADFNNDPSPWEMPQDDRGALIVPQFVEPPRFDAQGVDSYINAMVAMIEDRAGIHETSRGLVNPSINSGVQAQIAQGQDNTNLQRPIVNFKVGDEEFWYKTLLLFDAKMPNGKIVQMLGPGSELMVENYRKNFMNAIAGVVVRTTSRIPLEPEQRRDFVLKLAQMGLFAPEQAEHLQRIFQFMEFDYLGAAEVDEILQARLQALDENDRMDKGQSADIGPYELDDVHLKVHIDRMNMPDFAKLSERVQARYFEHVKLTEATKEKKATEEAQRLLRVQQAAQPQMPAQPPPKQGQSAQ